MLTKEQIQSIAEASLENSIALAASLFPGGIVFSSSLGQEDQLLTDIIFRNNLPVRIFTIDTGRLFNETYELLDRTNSRYKTSIKLYFPEAMEVEQFAATRGINSFYESTANRVACCDIRKVRPLNRALAGAACWITGLRREQSPNRETMQMIDWDDKRQLYKFNPLINWTYDEVINYIKAFDVPYNRLHDKGFLSIGCAPCTRAIEPGEDARAGRWWWESSQKECGLHQTISK